MSERKSTRHSVTIPPRTSSRQHGGVLTMTGASASLRVDLDSLWAILADGDTVAFHCAKGVLTLSGVANTEEMLKQVGMEWSARKEYTTRCRRGAK